MQDTGLVRRRCYLEIWSSETEISRGVGLLWRVVGFGEVGSEVDVGVGEPVSSCDKWL